jgi:hypothetical protein
MAFVACTEISEGLRSSEALVTIEDVGERRHSIRVERDFLTVIAGKDFLPVGLVFVDSQNHSALVEFPHEPETGLNRIWVRESQLHSLNRA